VHGSLLNEDLIQPKKLEMGISHRTGGRTGHFDWGRNETTPEWSAVAASVGLSSTRRFYKDFRNLRLAVVAKNREIRKQRVHVIANTTQALTGK